MFDVLSEQRSGITQEGRGQLRLDQHNSLLASLKPAQGITPDRQSTVLRQAWHVDGVLPQSPGAVAPGAKAA